MIENLFETLGKVAESFITMLASVFSGISAIFYTPATETTPGAFTFLGVLLLVAIGVSVVWAVYRLIVGLIGKIKVGSK